MDHLDEQSCIINTTQGSRPTMRILRTTRSLLVPLLVCLSLPGTAVANSSAGPPPGNSAVNQYLEVVPTASGGWPTGTLGSRNPSRPRASGLSPATRRALAHQGAAGPAVAGLASQATPTTQRSLNHSATTRHVGVAHRSGKVGAGQGKAGQRAASNGSNRTLSGGNAPLSTLAQSITGGSSSGGSEPVLPVVLLIILVGGGAMAMRRRKGLA